MSAPAQPARAASATMVSLSAALRRQPKVSASAKVHLAGEGGGDRTAISTWPSLSRHSS
jgi:hypothetical protein